MSAVSPSLDGVDINVGFARAVVEGAADGQLHTWETSQGTAYHAVHSYGMSLVWGDGVGEEFERIVTHLREGRYRTRDEWLQVDPRWDALPWQRELTRESVGGSTPAAGETDAVAETEGVSIHRRINFAFDAAEFLEARRTAPSLEGWTFVRADETDFTRPGSVVPAEFWRSSADFLAAGGGWRAERDGFRGALAFTSFRFGDELEIGIETHPDVRGRGVASAVTARMIDDLLDQGITPIWSCRDTNLASVALAGRLGFRPAKVVPYYRLPHQP